jgi:hypothetical protein
VPERTQQHYIRRATVLVIELIEILSRMDDRAEVKIAESTGTSQIEDVVYWPNSNTVEIS